VTWQPIETAPRDGTEVILFSPEAVYPGIFMARWDGKAWRNDFGDEPCDVGPSATHWKPMLVLFPLPQETARDHA
jgi:hypothetical protein